MNNLNQKSNISVSIIIPIYNSEATIRRCVESIINQKLKDIEIICVNDGSVDASGSIINELKSNDARILVLNQPNLGVSTARNLGLSYAKGKYVAFVDSDDYVKPEMYQYLFDAAEEATSDVICCNFFNAKATELMEQRHSYDNETITGHDNISEHVISPLLFSDVCTVGLPQTWNKLYRSSLIKKNAITFDTESFHGEDWMFNLHVFNKANVVTFIDSPLYFYNIHEGGLTTRFNPEAVKQLEKRHGIFVKEFPQFNHEGIEHAKWVVSTARMYIQSVYMNIHTSKERSCFLTILYNSKVYKKYVKIYKENTSVLQLAKEKFALLCLIVKNKIKRKARIFLGKNKD